MAMSRKEASARRVRTRRARPVIESLEGRQLLSAGGSHGASAQAASPGGVLSAKGQAFRYVTLTGGIATLKIVGVGSLDGTSVDSSGDLHIVYGGTNVYSKITGSVQGGGGHAPLASIQNLQLINAGQPNSLSGVGGTPVAAVLMSSFDLVPGGTINLTPGVTNVALRSIGSNSNVQLRNLPPAPSYRILPANAGNTAGGQSALFGVLTTAAVPGSAGGSSVLLPVAGGVPASGGSSVTTIVGTTLVPAITGNSSLSSGGSTGASQTLEAGESASITTAQGVTLSYLSDGGRSQVLTGVSGSFSAQPNLLEPLAPGQALTEPPAPPGIILKANSIGGHTRPLPNPLTDSKIFGYDPTTGQVVRFDLNLQSDTGKVDPTFAPISVPGKPATSEIDIAHDGNTLVLLVPSGKTVYAYNPETGAPIGSFTTAQPVESVTSAGNITVLGSVEINELHMINLPASLRTGVAQGLDSTAPFVPQAQVFGLGGLTGVAGSNNVYATLGAHFSSLQPTDYQLGVGAIGTVATPAVPVGTSTTLSGASTTIYHVSPLQPQFSLISRTGLLTNGNYTTIQVNPVPPDQIGGALGAVDQNLALDTGVSGGQNNLKLYAPSSLSSRGTMRLEYADLLTGLSQSFRTDLGGPALIDVQGDIQSVRSSQADGMLLNDTGNLATVKIQHINNSTIIGQPVSHLDFKSRTKTNVFTSARLAGNRNGATQIFNIQPIGPMSPSNNV
jgi:hypothetical protein